MQGTLRDLRKKGKDPNSIQALSCDSTSGTVLALNREGRTLSRAIMYNDGRAKEEAEIINREATSFTERSGYQFGASFALAKVLWWKRNNPELFDRAHFFLHAADFIVGKLNMGGGGVRYLTSLKMGYDLIDFKWPSLSKPEGYSCLQTSSVAQSRGVVVMSDPDSSKTGFPPL